MNFYCDTHNANANSTPVNISIKLQLSDLLDHYGHPHQMFPVPVQWLERQQGQRVNIAMIQNIAGVGLTTLPCISAISLVLREPRGVVGGGGGGAGHNTANNGNAARVNVPVVNVDHGDRVVGNHYYLGAFPGRPGAGRLANAQANVRIRSLVGKNY